MESMDGFTSSKSSFFSIGISSSVIAENIRMGNGTSSFSAIIFMSAIVGSFFPFSTKDKYVDVIPHIPAKSL